MVRTETGLRVVDEAERLGINLREAIERALELSHNLVVSNADLLITACRFPKLTKLLKPR